MIRVVIQLLAIFLLPIVLYAIYFAVQRRRAQRGGDVLPRWEDGPWFWLIFGGVALAVLGIVLFGLLKTGDPNVVYVPPSGPQ